MNKFRYPVLILAMFLAFWASVMGTTPAFADDSTPPPVDSPVVTDESTPPAVVGEAATVETVDGAVPPPEADTQSANSDPNDPIWCPTGVAPNPGVGGCTTTQPAFNGGLLPLLNNLSANGTIWLLGTYQGTVGLEGGAVNINGASLGTTSNYTLALKGGWTGTSTGTINSADPSEFNVPLNITNWNNTVTLSDILITGVSGSSIYALKVTSTKTITLTNVDVQNNTTEFGGASLINTPGTGDIIITDSTFNNNTGLNADGLSVSTTGAITIKNLSANGNTIKGASLLNASGTVAKAVTLNGYNNFNFNGGDGLFISSIGAVTLSNVTAMYNVAGSGVFVDNCSYNFGTDYCNNLIASNVTIKGTNNFSNNGWDGLRIWSSGVITLNNVTANDNGTDAGRNAANPNYYDGFGKGAFLNNYGAYTPKAINITGNNTFNGNASNGLSAISFGAIKVNNLTANGNGCNALYDVDAPIGCAGAYLDGAGVTVTGFGTFDSNLESGLLVMSHGAVALNNLYSNNNGSNGAAVNTYGTLPYNVSVLGYNVFTNNGLAGMYIESNGAVTLYNITANGNFDQGLYVDNTSAASARAVILTGINAFNGNGDTGLMVYSYGAITASNVTASYNFGGVYLDNCLQTAGTCTGYSPQPVTLGGFNKINDNVTDGLWIESRGTIRVTNVTATYNTGGVGVYLDNQWGGAVGSVIAAGYVNSSNNGAIGLEVYSNGAVTLANLFTVGNTLEGTYVSNDSNPLLPANVTIGGTNVFSENGKDGLYIVSYGAVLVNNVTANDNGNPAAAYGVNIQNAGGSLSRAVSVAGLNTFNGNYSGGLFVQSLGAITVSKVTASNNLGTGVTLDNKYNLFTAPVTVVGYGVFNNNVNNGIQISSNGAITTTSLTANGNTSKGADITNNSISSLASSSVNVTMLGFNTFNGNVGSNGLTILSDGQITLNNVTANDNGGYGAYLDNVTLGSVLKNILVNGSNYFINNIKDGLYFNATGSVSLQRVNASFNNDGVVDGSFSAGIKGTAVGSITLTCGNLFNNEKYGYDLTGASIILKGVFTSGLNTVNSSPTTITRTCPLP